MRRGIMVLAVALCGCSGDPASSPLPIGQTVIVYWEENTTLPIQSLDGQWASELVPIGTRAATVRDTDLDEGISRRVVVRFLDGKFKDRTTMIHRQFLRPVD